MYYLIINLIQHNKCVCVCVKYGPLVASSNGRSVRLILYLDIAIGKNVYVKFFNDTAINLFAINW